jgi:exosortase
MTSTRKNLLIHGGLGLVLAWAYWPALVDAADRWANDPQYSHAFLVPLFSGYLLWRNRAALAAADGQPRWWGLGLLAAGFLIRFVGNAIYLSWLDLASLLVCLAGWAATAGGRSMLRAALPAILFLGFTLPLPYRVQMAMGGNLQRIATIWATYLLQTVGVPAIAEGNIITLTEGRIGVVEACNGLSMLITFFAMATGFAMVVREPWWLRTILVASAAPIAVAANVFRITLTGVLYETSGGRLAHIVYHDVAGWLMMPLALGLLFVELWFLRRVVIAKTRTAGPVRAPIPRTAAATAS